MRKTAKKARKRAIEVCEKEKTLQLDEIEDYIEEACDSGEFVIRYYETLRQDVREILIENGYTLNDVEDGPNETSTIIKW